MYMIQIWGTEKYGEAFGKSLKHGRTNDNKEKNTDAIVNCFGNITKGFTYGDDQAIKEEFALYDLDINSEHGRNTKF